MAGYRFCRTDDVALLTRAYNDCYRAHFPALPPMTVDEFRRLMGELDLWCSSCMIAFADEEPIGVLLAAKRERETWIFRIGVRPDSLRRGHGSHLLGSLHQKIAVLGPPRIVAEVPVSQVEAWKLFEACGYSRENAYADFSLEGGPRSAARAEMVSAVTVDDLLEAGILGAAPNKCWERDLPTLINRKDRTRGLAIASSERIEAYLLLRDAGAQGASEITALGCEKTDDGRALLGLLIGYYAERSKGPIGIPKVSSEEVCYGLLEKCGFRRRRDYIGYWSTPARA